MTRQGNRLQALLNQHLRPRVKEIDEQGVYPGDILKLLGQQGYYSFALSDNLELIREVATVCMSTAFVVWCQAAAIRFVHEGNSDDLKRELLPSLLAGEVLGGTGISNAMKYYAGM
jgi:alkylation response protein AidB-like acyl-CoA dehydrogenase